MSFVHLHVHSQYSILDGLSSIEGLFSRAQELGMPAVALTDHGNMYGTKVFFDTANGKKFKGAIKPIAGIEAYVTVNEDHTLKGKEYRHYYHLILLAKNHTGYKNLMKISSIGFIEGKYGGRARVSHKVIEQYHEGLICCSACIAGEVPKRILEGDIEGARQAIRWHKGVFGEDYYLEVQSHKTEVPGQDLEVWEKQNIVNEAIFRLAEEEGVKVVATNDVHFVRKEDGPAHDRLICLSTGKKFTDTDRMHYTQQEYMKSEEEMAALFPGHPEVLANTLEVADKVEVYKIDRDPVLPVFELPKEFLAEIDSYLEKYKEIIDEGRCDAKGNYRGDDFCKSVAYLCYLTYQGATERYGELDDDTAGRILFELKTICKMGYPDYFLIVQDYIKASRGMGIPVGPGRGSAAGSVVAYCLTITNIDPIKYDLLFERFLNPDRISLPDIDVDFADEGRYRIFQYVEEKYGSDHVCHVVTFGTMAAKNAVKDVARVLDLPLPESNALTKMIGDKSYVVTEKNDEGEKVEKEYPVTVATTLKCVPEFKAAYDNGSELTKDVIDYAAQLDGSIRQTGVHACAFIIGRGDLTEYIPICLSEDKLSGKEVWVSQYDGHFIESVGMLKMDFLGLKTLSIIQNCLRMIKLNHNIDIDIEKIDIADAETYNLFSAGDTTSVFQFESPGMRKHLQNLHPDRFEDLIAMNALYRPGPMAFIPDFIARKHGEKEIVYELEGMEQILEDTYGITVYQEQVMLLSQKLAGFTKGQADKLRKAMGKKQIAVLNELEEIFMQGAIERGHDPKILETTWNAWKEFAKYAFNKSHSTCYAWVAYQTAWLKAHYMPEFQAANLTINLGAMDKMKVVMADCKLHNIKIKTPDINESYVDFSVNKAGEIRFGFGGIKGFGGNIASAIIEERDANGPYKDIWDLAERLGVYASEKSRSMAANVSFFTKKAVECLVYSGAFDSFGIPRKCYFLPTADGKDVFVDAIVTYADRYAKNKLFSEVSLFGGIDEIEVEKPLFSDIQTSGDETIEARLEILHKEKELVGMFLSDHPLNQYRTEIDAFTNISLAELGPAVNEAQAERPVAFAGFVLECKQMVSKNGNAYTVALLEDFEGQYELKLFGKAQEPFLGFLQEHASLYIEGKIKARRYQKEGQPQQFDLEVEKMNLLSSVMDIKTSGLTLFLDTSYADAEFIRGLQKVLKSHKGKKALNMWIYDKATDYNIEFVSRKQGVNITPGLIEDLQSLNIRYKI